MSGANKCSPISDGAVYIGKHKEGPTLWSRACTRTTVAAPFNLLLRPEPKLTHPPNIL